MGKQTTVESVVFVIDDDNAVRASLKSLFKSVGLNVELFGSTDEFLKCQRPDAACAGAVGFLTKSCSDEELIKFLHLALTNTIH